MRIKKLFANDLSIYKERLIQYTSKIDEEGNFEILQAFRLAIELNEGLETSIKHGGAIVFIAVEDDEIIGFAWAYNQPYRDDKKRLYVKIIHVQLEFRDRGIGHKLINNIERDAKELGHASVYLHLRAMDKNVYKFFNNMGYHKERIQLAKRIGEFKLIGNEEEHSSNTGRIRKIDSRFVYVHLSELANIYEEHVRAHILTESFSYDDSVAKMKAMESYLDQNMAYTYCYCFGSEIAGIVWVYSYGFQGEERLYVGEIQVKSGYRNMKIGQKLYNEVIKQMGILGIRTLFTHVDAKNIGSLRFHWKQDFKDEIYQMLKVCDR